jgi:type III secretion control protein HpaP
MARLTKVTTRSVERLSRARALATKEAHNKTRLVQLLEARLNQLRTTRLTEVAEAEQESEALRVQAIQSTDDARLDLRAQESEEMTVHDLEADGDIFEDEDADEVESPEDHASPTDLVASPQAPSPSKVALDRNPAGTAAMEEMGLKAMDANRPLSEVQTIFRDKSRSSALAQYLADTVACFCNDPAVSRSEGWQVSMPLNARILVGTTLHLSLSPHWCLLRFDTADEKSRALISKEETSLRDMLEESLRPRREVGISFQ